MRAIIGKNCITDDGIVLGKQYKEGSKPPKIGDNAIIRYGLLTSLISDCGGNISIWQYS